MLIYAVALEKLNLVCYNYVSVFLCSLSASRVLDIGSPKNFRHVQHGFPTTLPGHGAEPHNLSQSCTSSSNTINAANL